MLRSLSISNYALISSLELPLEDGLTIVTGETGSGKSIMLGALGLIFGDRADTSVLREQSQKCIVEGEIDLGKYGLKRVFDKHDLDYDDHTTIRREITSAGKSRAFVNDTPVNLAVLKEFREALVDIHSQHQTLLLNNPRFQLSVVDGIAGNRQLLADYRDVFTTWQSLNQELDALKEADKNQGADLDYNRFLLEELESTNLQANELSILEEEGELLRNASGIQETLAGSVYELDGKDGNMVEVLQQLHHQIASLGSSSEQIQSLAQRLNSMSIELKDIVSEVYRIRDEVQGDPQRLEEVEGRLSSIYSMLQKHRVQTIEELLQLRDELNAKIESAGNLDEKIEALEKQIAEKREKLSAFGMQLHESRENAIPGIVDQINGMLSLLGMPHAQLLISLELSEQPNLLGLDQLQFNMSTNKGEEFRALNKVASGGELSRVMLALKYMVSKALTLPVIVFDEIDTGVSGEIADKMAQIMHDMAENMQVITITHLPQIAGRGKHHYKVEKSTEDDVTSTSIRKLDDAERLDEVARMLSGEELTSAAIENAKVLLKT